MPRRRPRPVDETPDVETPDVVAKPTPSRKVDTPDTGVIETKEEPQPVKPAPATEQWDHREGVPSGVILGPNDPITLEGDDDGITVTVSRDVYRKVYPQGARRPSYILLYPRGMRVVKSLLQRQT